MIINRAVFFVGAIVAVVIATPAVAQQPQSNPAEYHLKITGAEVDLIGKALGTQPFSEVAPLVQKLRQQIMEQQQTPVPTPKPQEPK